MTTFFKFQGYFVKNWRH